MLKLTNTKKKEPNHFNDLVLFIFKLVFHVDKLIQIVLEVSGLPLDAVLLGTRELSSLTEDSVFETTIIPHS